MSVTVPQSTAFVLDDMNSHLVKNILTQTNNLVADMAALLAALATAAPAGYVAPTQASGQLSVHPPTVPL